jgi:PAS domain S-box-containing protein
MPGRQHRALLEREQRLRAIYDGTYEYIGVLAPDGTLLEANRASLEFAAGTTREDVVGRPFWETVWFAHTPGAPEKLREAITRAAAGETFRVEWPLRRPSGEEVVFDFSLRPVRDEHGDVVLIVPEGRDITDLRRAEQAARHQEERYRLLFERATDGIWLASQDGRFVDVNPAACRMLGYSHDEHVRLTAADIIRPGDRARQGDLMAQLATGGTVTDVWDIRRADGSYIPIELSHAFTPDGLWQANGRDITVRQRAEAQREQQRRDEHEISELLQRSLLPLLAELDVDGQGLAVRYEPAVDALEVGGDWYDAIALPGGLLAVAVGDVVGKGAAAAAVMGQLRSAARVLLLEGHGPAQVLSTLDNFARRIPEARCSTMFCALIDPAAATVTYSSAGHPPAILDLAPPDRSGGRGYELLEKAQSVPLAVLGDLERPQATATLPPGSALLLYTDGLVERRGRSIDVGIAAAAAVLAGARGVPPAECAGRLAGQLISQAHDDDAAFLLYRYPVPAGPPSLASRSGSATVPPLSLSFPAHPDELYRLRATLRDWLIVAGLDGPATSELLHAVGEVASNAIEHGSRLDPARRVALIAEQEPGRVRVAVSDNGRWVEPAPAGDSGRGRGLMLAHALIDDLDISATGAGTTVQLIKRTATHEP